MKPTAPLRFAARTALVPGTVLILYLLWSGHNAPGGGFIAGLVTLALIALQLMGRDPQTAARRWSVSGLWLLAGGLGLAAGTGLGAFLFARPFLSSAILPGHVSTAFFFDLGVYGVVVGSGWLILRLVRDYWNE